MGFQKKPGKPELVLDPTDPAVIEEKRMLADQERARAIEQEEQARMGRIAAEDHEKIERDRKAREAEQAAIDKAAQADSERRMNTPLNEIEREELAGLEAEAGSGRECPRHQMLRLSELRQREENEAKAKEKKGKEK